VNLSNPDHEKKFSIFKEIFFAVKRSSYFINFAGAATAPDNNDDDDQ